MPIYEFYSPDTHKIYSFYARRIISKEMVPHCPDGKKHRMERLLSNFSFTGRAIEPKTMGPGDGPVDPRQEAAMMEIAGEIERMGDSDPDPKTLGHLMRKMQGIMGQDMPAGMDEMIGRLEAGEDPETLEEKFGDILENDPSEGGDAPPPSEQAKSFAKRIKKPERDPTLYELSEFLGELGGPL